MKQDPNVAAFSHLLISGTLVHEADFSELQQQYGVGVHPRLVMVVSIDRYPDLAARKPDTWPKDVGHALVEAIVETVTRPYTWIWTEEGVLALLIECAQSAGAGVRAHMMRMAKDIQASSKAKDISVSIGIGGVYEHPTDLHHSFQEAIQSMSGRFFQGNSLIFVYGEDVSVDEVWGGLMSTEKTEVLALVRIGDEQGVVTQLRILLDRLAKECRFNEDMFRSEVVDVVMMVSRSIVESGVNASAVLTKNAHFIRDLYQTIRYDKFVHKVCDYVQWLTAQVGQTQMPKVSPVIRQAIYFMKQHHRNSISLEEVARYCCLSKYHLSHLFKKEAGCGVIDFLNKIRVEKAVFYLQTTEWPIQQIASQVGFQDANYFSRIFKKYTKCSPRDFRIAI